MRMKWQLGFICPFSRLFNAENNMRGFDVKIWVRIEYKIPRLCDFQLALFIYLLLDLGYSGIIIWK